MPSMVQRERWERMVPRAVSIARVRRRFCGLEDWEEQRWITSETVLGLSSATVR